jgi:hypothetical protein
MEMAEIRSKRKPANSTPIFNATIIEYKIAVKTPNHSRILLFIIDYSVF